jgi:class 3 adenylate cyclase
MKEAGRQKYLTGGRGKTTPRQSSMIVVFCDLKGSTQVLRELGARKFQGLQEHFFAESSRIVTAANRDFHANNLKSVELLFKKEKKADQTNEREFIKPWARIDKFMGDCVMFYVDCGGRKGTKAPAAILNQGALMTMRIVVSLIEAISDLGENRDVRAHHIRLGSRIGIALGHDIILSPLGERGKPGFSYTLTGESVNLAARLEHASKAEFLDCISAKKSELQAYLCNVSDSDRLHGTALGEIILETDRHLIDLFTVCEKTFQIRTNELFVHHLTEGDQPVKLRWRSIPFMPKGFEAGENALFLGGDSTAELFRTV